MKLDSGHWMPVRCVKLTHAAGEVMQEGDLSTLLAQRMAAYQDVGGEDDEDMDGGECDQEDQEDDECPANEGLGPPQPLHDGLLSEDEEIAGALQDAREDCDVPSPTAEDWELLLDRTNDADSRTPTGSMRSSKMTLNHVPAINYMYSNYMAPLGHT